MVQPEWDSLGASDVHDWSQERESIPEWVFRSIGAGCGDAVVGFSRLGSVLAEDMIRVAEIGVQAENGELPTREAKAAFTEWGQSALLVGELAEAGLEFVDDSQGVLWVGKVGEAASSAGFNAISLAIFAFPDDSNDIDQEGMNVWLDGLNDAVTELLDTSFLFEDERVCS